MKMLKIVDQTAFSITVVAGFVAAVASAFGWTWVAVVAGCTAVIAPIVNRIATARQQREFIKKLGPRSLSTTQRQRLIESLGAGPSFKIWVAHNRHEAEPSNFHKQIFDALSEAGMETMYFGGMNNNTLGIEISGASSHEKTRLMDAFTAADIPFLPIEFTDPAGQHWGIAVWIGVSPGGSSPA